MEALTKIIEDMAFAQFKADTKTPDQRMQFILMHSTLSELLTYFNEKSGESKKSLFYAMHKDRSVEELLAGGIGETYLYEMVWRKLKDTYVSMTVKALENKVNSIDLHITIS